MPYKPFNGNPAFNNGYSFVKNTTGLHMNPGDIMIKADVSTDSIAFNRGAITRLAR